ncbi:MAG: hypothetical protein POG74_07915 [Acidocella sp.]|nr:hypothetical protein [Acidocella sp.]
MAQSAKKETNVAAGSDDAPMIAEKMSLRRVAANFISNDEQNGLDEIDQITSRIYKKIHQKHIIFETSFTASTTMLLLSFIIVVLISPLGHHGIDNALLAIEALSGLTLFAALLFWSRIQYNFGRKLKPRPTIHMAGSKQSLENLEKFFAVMQREATPRAYYHKKDGSKAYLDRRYFYGSLRPLLLSEDRWVRALVFSPNGLWFSHEIFIQANVQVLIQQASAKPKFPGAPKIHDYTDAVMSLIEHPVIRHLKLGKRGNQQCVIDLLSDWYVLKGQKTPSEGQLRNYAMIILDVIQKNRTASK